MKYAKGIMWLDDCRIPFVDEGDKTNFNYNSEGINRQKTSEDIFSNIKIIGNHSLDDTRQQGRFTPNLLVCDDMLNDGNLDGGSSYCPPTFYDKKYETNALIMTNRTKTGYGDKGTNSRYYDLDKWFDKVIEQL